MKKKLLSLVLAGAMVASTSVSAFADVTTEEVTMSASQDEQNVNIGINGNIVDDKGNTLPGTIKVTVPTATTFSVAKNGVLTSPIMTISNDSEEGIIVTASKFEDLTGDQQIKVIKKTDFETTQQANVPRNEIWLRLKGDGRYIGLTSESNNGSNGKMYNADYGSDAAADTEIGRIDAKREMTLELEGEGGTQGTASKAVRDDFKLVLKIKRAKKQ